MPSAARLLEQAVQPLAWIQAAYGGHAEMSVPKQDAARAASPIFALVLAFLCHPCLGPHLFSTVSPNMFYFTTSATVLSLEISTVQYLLYITTEF
jgi:hypothetical protein